MEEFTGKYREYKIDYDETNERFRAFVDGNVAFENPSLRGIKIQIDTFEKAQSKKDFKRFKVWVDNWRFKRCNEPSGYVEGEVTSITEDGAYWITVKGQRSKEFRVVLSNLENNNKIAILTSLNNEVERIRSEYNEIKNSLVVLEKGKRPEGEN